MTQVRCPRRRCIHWIQGWCGSDEIELDLIALSCNTFEEAADESDEDLDELDELEWDDEDSLLEDELNERFYVEDDDEDEDDDLELELLEDDDW